MKKCPFCGEILEDDITKCLFCERPLGGGAAAGKVKWYQSTSSMIIGFLMVGPLILPVVWLNPHFSPKKKIVISAIIVILTLGMIYLFGVCMKSITQYYGAMGAGF